uniref:Uncharacterized protein n=1 Tax=Salarias fasciatus TaxID=181472 RepID=A0A672G376_SALFA
MMTMLTEQNLSLIKNSARMEEPTSALPHLKHGATLRLVVSPQDEMLDALGEKVAEVHRCCVDDRLANLSTLEKLSNIERRMSSLLQGLESIPEDKLEMTKKIKDSERRSRYTQQQNTEVKMNILNYILLNKYHYIEEDVLFFLFFY